MVQVCTEGLDTGFVSLGYAKVAVLGVVQGITELLPISSTAHMRIVPAFLGWRDPGSAFSAAMQLAALAAVIGFFWKDIRDIVLGSLGAVVRRDFGDWNFRFAIWIVLATLPIIVAGILLKPLLNQCDSPLRTLPVIGIACITMAVLLAIAEGYCKHSKKFEQVTLMDAMVVGIAQVGALIPGVSRSGSSLTAAFFRDLKREDAARFSYILGIPAITGAGVKELYELWKVNLSLDGWLILAVGLVVASISAFAAIWGLLRILERFSSWPFVIYRAAMGVFLLVASAAGWLA